MGHRAKPLPPLAELQQRYSYCPESGQITFLRSRYKARVGTEAGRVFNNRADGNSYKRITVSKGQEVYAHRLAWILYHGTAPHGEIDHVDGNGLNNCISNLRDVSHRDNLRNIKPVHSASGVKGVYWDGNSYKASISDSGGLRHLGRGDLLHCAALRKSAEQRLGYL
jgi:hypothetical protein